MKEDLINLRYLKHEVLHDSDSVSKWGKNLEKALSLGNIEHLKVKMTFLDLIHKVYVVEITVWAVTKEHVCLKGELVLHKSALLTIEFI